MRLSLSVAARSRAFAKAMRRIRPKFASLFTEFEGMQLANPIHEAILLGISDELDGDEIQITPNSEGFFQVICGFDSKTPFDPENYQILELTLFRIIRSAVETCPFTEPDKRMMLGLINTWAARELAETRFS
ncbi:hypothetical protein [Pseudomonas sp. Gutcm_11s]|uniref:hypothetical protein n=1 Tax=Pseudomonas sp. Gutcm_11s TaxID=3026088 RepID=UPI0023626327|nr:hypothetical protein [Pseudomonas sp. Gutcm_11s]MDD0841271.1 hypothetical protein [Pseudomonas sp. Gutcm_11s]